VQPSENLSPEKVASPPDIHQWHTDGDDFWYYFSIPAVGAAFKEFI
jgi:hypothetical protein